MRRVDKVGNRKKRLNRDYNQNILYSYIKLSNEKQNGKVQFLEKL